MNEIKMLYISDVSRVKPPSKDYMILHPH